MQTTASQSQIANRKLEILTAFSCVIWLLISSGILHAQAQTQDDKARCTTLYNEMASLSKAGKYADAIKVGEELVKLAEKAFGPESAQYASYLDGLAYRYKDLGDYAKSEPLYKQAVEIKRKALGENDPSFALSLRGLGSLYAYMGDYARAEPLCKQALEIIRKTLGENHPDYARSLNNVGGLYQSMGDYARAEPLLKQAIQIIRKTLGENHPDYACSLYGLGYLYDTMCDYARAEPLERQALEILRKTYGENHIGCVWALYGLAGTYYRMGDYARAEPLLKEAMEMWRRSYGENCRGYSLALGSLARLYCFAQGEYAKAEPLYKQAMEIERKTVGENSRLYAGRLNDLARLYQAMGDYAKAEPLFKQGTEIFRKSLGENHPYYAYSLNRFAVLYAAWGKPVEGLECFDQCMTSLHGHTVKVLAGLSQEKKLSFLHGVWWKLEMYLSFVLRYPNTPGSVAGGALWLARWKALSMELQTEQYRLQRQMRTLVEQMDAARREVARWTLSPPAGISAEEARQKREENEAKLAEIEEALAKTSGEFAEIRKLGSADLTQIAQALPKDAALLDFARFRRCNFRPFSAATGTAMGKEPNWGESRYVVFITPSRSTLNASRSTEQVVFVDLGPAQPIDDAVAAFRAAIESPTTNHVSRFTDHESRITEPLKTLSKLVLDRILPHVKDRKHLIICPDGQLALVPFECLQTNDGKYLVESFQISYLGARPWRMRGLKRAVCHWLLATSATHSC
jgi:tetratricopeptide (TPR) repeat protein